MKLIKRETYLEKLRAVRGVPDIKVITGLRRSGKSKLMDCYAEEVACEKNVNLVRINLNLKKFDALKNADRLYAYVQERYLKNRENLLFIDEVQMCSGFEQVINSLHEEERFDIYVTGSNAFLMSSDLATLFRGRTCEISVFPFSFAEYVKYHASTDTEKAFDCYVKNGGLSGSYLYQTNEQALSYVKNVFRATVVRDIVEKYHIENEELLIMLADYLMDNIGNKTSIRNISNCLPGKTNDKTIASYITYLIRAFLFYPTSRYDIKGKKYFETEKKYYLADTAFRFSELGTKTPDWGRLYENIVAIELLRRGYEVYVGELYKKEVDFVAIKDGIRTYIQVSDDISREETLKREVAPLLSIRDAYPKMVLARTRHEETQIEGVQVINIADWLLSGHRLSEKSGLCDVVRFPPE